MTAYQILRQYVISKETPMTIRNGNDFYEFAVQSNEYRTPELRRYKQRVHAMFSKKLVKSDTPFFVMQDEREVENALNNLFDVRANPKTEMELIPYAYWHIQKLAQACNFR